MKGKEWLEDVYKDISSHYQKPNDENEHILRILKLVRQPSIAATEEGIEECAGLVMELLTEIGCYDVHMERYVKSPIVMGRLKADAEDAPTIFMYGMYDCQPPEPLEEWTVPPFEGVIKDFPPYGESMIARGVANSKAPLVCFLNSVDSIKKTLGYLPVNINFVVEGEEELGSKSMVGWTQAHLEELKASDGVFLNGTRQDEDGRPFTILGNKGIIYIDVEVTGGKWGGPKNVDLHSMNAAWIGSPVWRLINALASMRDGDDNILIDGFYDDLQPLSEADEALTQRMIDVFDEDMYLNKRLMADRFIKNLHGADALRNLLWKPTLNIDGIWAGYTGPATKTIIPHKAFAKIDVRLVPPMKAEDTLKRIKKHLEKYGFDDVKLTIRQQTPWSKDDPECLASRACIAAMDNSGYENGSPWPIFPGSGPAYLFTDKAKVAYVSYGLGKSGRIHAPDEWMTIKGMKENEMSCSAFIYYLAKLSEESKKKQHN